MTELTREQMTERLLRNGPDIEYSMSKELAQELLNARKGDDKKLDRDVYLCKYVNTEKSLLGYCVGIKLI